MIAIGAAFDAVYLSAIRNAVFHADYTITDTEFHMVRDHWLSPKGYQTRDVPLPELFGLIDRACAFYYALLNHHELARASFARFKDLAFPFDPALKGLIEFLFEDDMVCGFRVYWPNGQQGVFMRTSTGSRAINIWPTGDRLNFEVGLYASTPGAFSPLVDAGQASAYSPAEGRTIVPYWPMDGQPVVLV